MQNAAEQVAFFLGPFAGGVLYEQLGFQRASAIFATLLVVCAGLVALGYQQVEVAGAGGGGRGPSDPYFTLGKLEEDPAGVAAAAGEARADRYGAAMLAVVRRATDTPTSEDG